MTSILTIPPRGGAQNCRGAILRWIALGCAALVLADLAKAAPSVYTDEALFYADLGGLEGSTLFESFEDDLVWAESRNAISSPGSAPSVTSQGLVWTSNFPQNEIATGTVGGSAPDGEFAIYSFPHGMATDSGLYCDSAEDPDIPLECYQNDGLRVESAIGNSLFAFGGRIDTANNGKVSFLLDGVDIYGNDTDNIDNWQREGELADHWAFVGVIDPDGFSSVELRELRGKDFQQVLLFSDGFTVRAAPEPTAFRLYGGALLTLVGLALRRNASCRSTRASSHRNATAPDASVPRNCEVLPRTRARSRGSSPGARRRSHL